MYNKKNSIKYIDLFCGIGGFRYAIENAAKSNTMRTECVFSSDIDKQCQDAYHENFSEKPFGDITKINSSEIPAHDILLAGFPCQPFSIIGQRKGFKDERGTLFFDILRILKDKQPSAFVLENVKSLATHNKNKTINEILKHLKSVGYNADYRVLNAMDYGLPQKRERIFIVGFKNITYTFCWPDVKMPMTPLSQILEKNPDPKYFVSETIRQNRLAKHKQTKETTIWHENKSGHISSNKFSCALRAGASYNYLLVNGERRLTSREMLRLQGFPESFKISCSYTQTRKQAGNSLPVPVAEAVLNNVISTIKNNFHNLSSKSYSVYEPYSEYKPQTVSKNL